MTSREELIALDRDSLEQQVIHLEQKLESAQFERDELAQKIERITSHIRCIYCDQEYSAEQKDELADHILSCNKSPIVQLCRQYEGMLDMMVDEFSRIVATTEDTEIIGICNRAAEKIRTTVPLIDDRDKWQARAEKAEAACAEMRDQLNRIRTGGWQYVEGTQIWTDIDNALDTDAGKGWVSPEKRKLAVEALERVWDEDEMGWIIIDDEGANSECVKCGAILPHGGHTEDCLQGIIHKAIAALKESQ